ncbi:MAG: protease inhibitor I42 family protein [Acidobacteriaceae bacterium]
MPIAAQAQTTTPPTTAEVGELGPQVRVSLRAGDTLRIVLPSTPSTGYSWRPADKDTAGAIHLKSSTFKSGQQRPGAAGTQTITLTANSPGEDHLVLNYARPWEKGTKPARTYSVNIAVSSEGGSPDSPVVTPAGTLIGTYSGKSRCADCSGILTTVAFYAATPQQMTDTYYVRTTKYLGSPKGDTTFVSAGNWSLKTGTPVDPKAVVYSLHSNTSDHVDTYQLKGDTLLVIGSDGKPAQNPYNTNLQKQP